MKPLTLGACYRGDGRCRFRVWAPKTRSIHLHVVSPEERILPMEAAGRGYYELDARGIEPGALYYYRLDHQNDRPDPASRYQPQGVHGPSCVIDPDFRCKDQNWAGIPLAEYIVYEIHVGTFSEEGTFGGVVRYLDELKTLGITAIELMPVAQFPGKRNWGYDGVYPFAVQDSYGGPDGLKHLVDACHNREIAVILDVVYNHIGPEGNYFGDFGPYFTPAYQTPWGEAINFDGSGSDEVRNFFIENAIYWGEVFHMDALRLDAVHAIIDRSAYPFLLELSERTGGCVHLIAESDRNDARLVQSPRRGGYGLDAMWNDDFHHSLHAMITGESAGYYEDFGSSRHFEKALREGFVYSGEFSRYRGHRHGSSSREIGADRFVVFSQNHDQVGNRARGDRLSSLISMEALKLAAGAVILSPFIPLLFMGEEYGEAAPFLYFTSHSDRQLVEAVRSGRREEFAGFNWRGEVPDPQDEATFERCRLKHHRRGPLYEYYKELIRLRKGISDLNLLTKKDLQVQSVDRIVLVHRGRSTLVALNFADAPSAFTLPSGNWRVLLDSSASRWGGPGSDIEDDLQSNGNSMIRLAPYAVVLLSRRD